MSGRIMQILAAIAKKSVLQTLHTLCETQRQVSTHKLERYLDDVGDVLAGYAYTLRVEYDALQKSHNAALAELAALKGGQGPVAEVSAETFSSDGTSDIITCNLPIGTKLYTAAQSGAWVPDINKMARALSDRHSDLCGVDREDQWKIYSQDFIDDVNAVLAASPTPGASDGKGGA